jgi:hypothetical protein
VVCLRVCGRLASKIKTRTAAKTKANRRKR